mgnify:CR=1 FL=1
MYVVLVYDISVEDKGAKRWRSVFKICKKYLSHIQNSVFEGEISKVQLTKMQNELKPHIDKNLDSVIVFKSRQENKNHTYGMIGIVEDTKDRFYALIFAYKVDNNISTFN